MCTHLQPHTYICMCTHPTHTQTSAAGGWQVMVSLSYTGNLEPARDSCSQLHETLTQEKKNLRSLLLSDPLWVPGSRCAVTWTRMVTVERGRKSNGGGGGGWAAREGERKAGIKVGSQVPVCVARLGYGYSCLFCFTKTCLCLLEAQPSRGRIGISKCTAL